MSIRKGGKVQRLKSEQGFAQTVSAQEIGQRDSLEFTLSQSEQSAAQLAKLGINVNFAPVVDLAITPDNPIIGRIGRAFSKNHETVTVHAQKWIEGHLRHRVLCSLKHFPGHGSSASDSHLGFVDISKGWKQMELQPYRSLIAGGYTGMIMIGHLFNSILDPDFPATLSKKVIAGLLRNKLNFDGIVVTDDMQMKAITNHYGFEESIQCALAAGVDMIVVGNNLEYNENAVRDGVRAVLEGLATGKISEARVAEALARIERAKQLLGNNRHGS